VSTIAIHEATLIATVAASLGLALIFGFIAAKLRMPPLVGYLVAGIVIGPHTRGFVGDVALAGQLADIGVMLLMFGVGLHFSLQQLAAVRKLVVSGALIQVTLAAALGAGIALAWGWNIRSAIVLGLCLSVASTVVLLRTLGAKGLLQSVSGQVAIGWLIVQDLLMIVVLVLLPPLSAGGNVMRPLAITFGKIAIFAALMFIVGRRVFPLILSLVAKTGSRELFTLCVIAAAVGVAYGSAHLFGLSFALGAFFAGMMMRESALVHRAAEQSLPLQDAFAVLFFVSAGMLFDPMVLVRQPFAVLTAASVVMIATPLIAASIVLAFGYPASTAFTVAAGLAQIGEFSFILAGQGVSLGLLTADQHGLLLATALVTIALNPLLFAVEQRLQRSEREISPLERHVVIAGYGRVGRRIAEALVVRRIPHVVIERSGELVERLRARNIAAVAGDASVPEVLIEGQIARARMLVIAVPETEDARKIIDIARALNPQLEIVVREDDAARALADVLSSIMAAAAS
jgi:CPA2 family monovalent cation:H+ antiporter-2